MFLSKLFWMNLFSVIKKVYESKRPIFCTQCGERLRMVETFKYDPDTGERKDGTTKTYLLCSNHHSSNFFEIVKG